MARLNSSHLASRRLAPRAFGVLLGALLLGTLPPWNPRLVTEGLAGSWFVVTNHALLQGWQWGTELVFTTGPLGFLFTGAYHPQLWPVALLFWALVALSLTWVLLELTADLNAGVRGILLVSLGVLMAFQSPGNVVFLALPLLAGFSLERPTLEVRPVTLVLVVASAVAGLAKLSSLPLAFVTLLLVDLWRLAHRRPPLLLPLWIVSLTAGFALARQNPTHLPAFLRSALETISGYSEAMAESGPAWEVWVVAGGLLTLLIVQGLAVAERRSAGAARGAVLAEVLRWLLLAGWALLAFKSSVVRQGHILTGWGCLALAALPLANVAQGLKSRRIALPAVLAVFVSATVCLTWAVSERRSESLREPLKLLLRDGRALGRLVVSPARQVERYRLRYDAAMERLRRENQLPRVQGSVDMLPADAAVLIAHRLDYRPRPSFQDYATYTPALAKLNRDFSRGQRAPDSLLISDLGTLDGRLPSLNEAGLWPTLLSRYRSEERRGRWLLLRLREAPRSVTRVPLRKFEATAGDPIALPAGDTVWATIRVRRTLLGRLARFAYHLEPPQIVLRLADQSYVEHRWVPGMSEDGILLSPYVRTVEDLQQLWRGDVTRLENQRVMEATIELDAVQRWLYDARLEVELERLDIPREE